MAMFVLTDEAGEVKGFYSDAVFASLPPGVAPISDEDWVSWLEAQSRGKRLGFLAGVLEVEMVQAPTGQVAAGQMALATPAAPRFGPDPELRQDYSPAPIIDRQ